MLVEAVPRVRTGTLPGYESSMHEWLPCSVVDMLDHIPPLPLVVAYRDAPATIGAQDEYPVRSSRVIAYVVLLSGTILNP